MRTIGTIFLRIATMIAILIKMHYSKNCEHDHNTHKNVLFLRIATMITVLTKNVIFLRLHKTVIIITALTKMLNFFSLYRIVIMVTVLIIRTKF